MTVLEATVEIVKAIMGTPQASDIMALSDAGYREKILKGVEDVYKKLEELEKDKQSTSKQW